MIQESGYMELLKNCSNFSTQLEKERKGKNPFLDAQTGIAQKPGNLWRSRRDRRPGTTADVVYVYPSVRWKKKKKDISGVVPDFRFLIPPGSETFAMPQEPRSLDPVYLPIEPAAQVPKMVPDPGLSSRRRLQMDRSFKESSYAEYDEMEDEMDDYEDPSDGDEYAEAYKTKSRKSIPKKKTASGAPYTLGKDGKKRYFGGAAAALIPPEEKPYSCPYCGAKYKSKPGLNYHLAHVHSDFNAIQKQNSVNAGETSTPPAAGGPASSPAVPTPIPVPNLGSAPPSKEPPLQISNYCDFCLGTGTENKKTGQPEELTSCHDCGRSGHPTCLKFTPNMIISTKKYGWQCIECKSCAICGTSENDDQLLFCDDCDRGFHLYCLNPPLQKPPEGEWSCHLCQVEFGPRASNPAPQYANSAPKSNTS